MQPKQTAYRLQSKSFARTVFRQFSKEDKLSIPMKKNLQFFVREKFITKGTALCHIEQAQKQFALFF